MSKNLQKITSIASSNPSINYFLMHNLIIGHLIWMFHSCQNNKKIKHLPEGCLHLIQKDKLSSYEELLEKDGQSLLIIETSCFRDASDKIWLVSRNCN